MHVDTKRRLRRPQLLATVLVIGGLVAAGCGSDNKNNSSSNTTAAGGTATTAAPSTETTAASGGATTAASGGATTTSGDGTATTAAAAGSEGLAKAQALVAPYVDRPTKLELGPKIDKPIPTGKTVYQITCGAEACDAESQMIKQATDILGWNLKTLNTDGSPQQIQNAWEQVVREKPDGVIYTATPRAQIDQYLKQAEANGTNVAACCIVEPATDGITWTTSTPDQAAQLAKVMAAWPIVDAAKDGNMKPGAVYLNIPDLPILSAAGKSMESTYKDLCPDCEFNTLDIGLADLAGAPDQVVSFLRSHPNTQYVIQSTDSVFLGLPAALKAAGLNDKVKIFGEGPTSAVQANIANGDQAGTMAFAFYEIMFGAVDALARAEAGVPQFTNFNPPNWILTKDNIPSPNEYFPVVPNALDQFKEVWGK
jgi:ABC-type sugar transport system substrate-binding protein